MNKQPDNRKALGKGLSALLPARKEPPPAPPAPIPATPAPVAAPTRLPLTAIEPNANQPRSIFRPEQLAELTESIKVHGVLQPLLVRKRGDAYELVAGERRWRAARAAGLTEVPVVIQDIADAHLLEIALVENIQREDLNPMETAQAFERLAREFQLSHEEIARRTGKDRSTVTNMIRLLKLPAEVQTMVTENRLSMGHARALLGLSDPEQQRSLADRTVTEGLSVRNVERLIQKLLEPRDPEPDAAAKEEKADPNVQAAIEEMERILGTRVRIVPKGTTRGRIEIEYFSQDDLDRLYLHIVGD